MNNNKRFSQKITVFHGRPSPEPGYLVGYGAIIEALGLPVPLPLQLVLISEKRRQYIKDGWIVLTPRHQPGEDLYDQLVFVLKYEGVNLLIIKKIFEVLEASMVVSWVKKEPLSQYSRRLWFLYEWLMQERLDVPDLKEGNYVPLLSEKLHYGTPIAINSPRHRIKNNLPGTIDFCPLIHRTPTLEKYISEDLAVKSQNMLIGVRKDILLRAAAFLMLKDSKASFTIEGENPTQNRAIRWGNAIGEAGITPLDKNELLRLQKIILEGSRFAKLGFRSQGGFVGEHDRNTGAPIPEHISARWQDLDKLTQGLLDTAQKMIHDQFSPVFAAATIAFGFVYIHPFVDGNGRLHRYLMHYLLATMKFVPQGLIFPISVAVLEKLEDYRKVLESYSHPLLEFIDWKTSIDHNVEVLNDTIDYYRYFDATLPATFLFECVDYTIQKIIPEEVAYLDQFDKMKSWLSHRFQMTDKAITLLIRFLEQNNGKLSKRGKATEFSALTDREVAEIEEKYLTCFG